MVVPNTEDGLSAGAAQSTLGAGADLLAQAFPGCGFSACW